MWQGDGMANPQNGDSVKLVRFAKKIGGRGELAQIILLG